MKLTSQYKRGLYFLILFFIGCTKNDSGITGATPSVSLSGTLALSSGSAANYAVVVQDTSTKELSIGTVSSDGSFSVSLSSSLSAAARFNAQARQFRIMGQQGDPSTNSATVSIVDSNGTFIAPVTFSDASANNVATAFKPEEVKKTLGKYH